VNQWFCFERQRHVERASNVDAEELRRGHANNRDGGAVHDERCADRARGPGETTLPEPLADDRDRPLRTPTRSIVGGRERAAENRRHAERTVASSCHCGSK